MAYTNKPNPDYFSEGGHPIATTIGVVAAIGVLTLVVWFIFESIHTAESAALSFAFV